MIKVKLEVRRCTQCINLPGCLDPVLLMPPLIAYPDYPWITYPVHISPFPHDNEPPYIHSKCIYPKYHKEKFSVYFS